MGYDTTVPDIGLGTHGPPPLGGPGGGQGGSREGRGSRVCPGRVPSLPQESPKPCPFLILVYCPTVTEAPVDVLGVVGSTSRETRSETSELILCVGYKGISPLVNKGRVCFLRNISGPWARGPP